MNATTLFLRNDQSLSIETTPEAIAARDAAIESSALIGAVRNAEEQEAAIAAMLSHKQILKATEDSRLAIKGPVLDFCRAIDTAAKIFASPCHAEHARLSRVVGDYQALEQAKAKAAEAARMTELEDIERQRQAALAQAKSHDELDRINEQFNAVARDGVTPSAPPKAAGQIVRQEWNIIVRDIHALYRANPNCVKLTPLLSEIKALLDMGLTVPGVTATKETVVGVRLTRQAEALAV